MEGSPAPVITKTHSDFQNSNEDEIFFSKHNDPTEKILLNSDMYEDVMPEQNSKINSTKNKDLLERAEMFLMPYPAEGRSDAEGNTIVEKEKEQKKMFSKVNEVSSLDKNREGSRRSMGSESNIHHHNSNNDNDNDNDNNRESKSRSPDSNRDRYYYSQSYLDKRCGSLEGVNTPQKMTNSDKDLQNPPHTNHYYRNNSMNSRNNEKIKDTIMKGDAADRGGDEETTPNNNNNIDNTTTEVSGELWSNDVERRRDIISSALQFRQEIHARDEKLEEDRRIRKSIIEALSSSSTTAAGSPVSFHSRHAQKKKNSHNGAGGGRSQGRSLQQQQRKQRGAARSVDHNYSNDLQEDEDSEDTDEDEANDTDDHHEVRQGLLYSYSEDLQEPMLLDLTPTLTLLYYAADSLVQEQREEQQQQEITRKELVPLPASLPTAITTTTTNEENEMKVEKTNDKEDELLENWEQLVEKHHVNELIQQNHNQHNKNYDNNNNNNADASCNGSYYYKNNYYIDHHIQYTTPAEELQRFLRLLSRVQTTTRREYTQQRAQAIEAATCATLYESGMTRQEMERARLQQYARQKEAAELAQCTFQPSISPQAARRKGKGLRTFMYRCIEWEEAAARKLSERYAALSEQQQQQQQNTSVNYSVQMNETSRRLLKENATKPRAPLWAPKVSAAEAPLLEFSHRPVTAARIAQQEALLKAAGPNHDPTNATNHAAATSSSSVATSKVSVKKYLERVNKDLKRRELTAEKLRRQYHGLYGEEQQFEERTGQPLYKPNAWPTLLKDGKRVPYYLLDDTDKKKLRDQLKANHAEHALIKLLRKESEYRQRAERMNFMVYGRTESTNPSDVSKDSALAEAVMEEQSTSPAELLLRLEKEEKRRLENRVRSEQKFYGHLNFKPELSKRSTRMARRKTGGRKIYERPMYSRQHYVTQKAIDEEYKKCHQLYVATDKEAAERVIARNEQWMESRERRLQRSMAERESKEMADCTFFPSRKAAHQIVEGSSIYPQITNHSHNLRGGSSSPEQQQQQQQGGEGNKNGNGRGAVYTMYNRGRKSSVYSPETLDRFAAGADLRLLNELELLRAAVHHQYLDPNFVEAVVDRTHERKQTEIYLHGNSTVDGVYRSSARPSNATSVAGALVPASSSAAATTTSKKDNASRTNTVLSSVDPYTALTKIGLRDAPRLPKGVVGKTTSQRASGKKFTEVSSREQRPRASPPPNTPAITYGDAAPEGVHHTIRKYSPPYYSLSRSQSPYWDELSPIPATTTPSASRTRTEPLRPSAAFRGANDNHKGTNPISATTAINRPRNEPLTTSTASIVPLAGANLNTMRAKEEEEEDWAALDEVTDCILAKLDRERGL